jgi:hypothetical protein
MVRSNVMLRESRFSVRFTWSTAVNVWGAACVLVISLSYAFQFVRLACVQYVKKSLRPIQDPQKNIIQIVLCKCFYLLLPLFLNYLPQLN